MKLRTGFVSNSSSSSFVISKHYLSDHQLEVLKARIEEGDTEWDMEERIETWFLHTGMDNFDMETFCVKELKIPRVAIGERRGG